MRWLLHFIATISLCVAVLTIIVDAARSVGASRFIFTPLGDMLIALGLATPATLRGDAPLEGSLKAWETVNENLLQSPVWLLFGVLALMFYIAGYRRRVRS